MFCKSCGYRLWNLPARQCPECGMHFAPSDFDFAPYSVRFHCPHCSKAYYGNGPSGHLLPMAFNCVDCGRQIHMDEMLLSPAEGVAEAQTIPLRSPWYDRRKIGFFRAFNRAVGQSMTAPTKLVRGLPPDSSTGDAWLFAFLANMIPPLTIVGVIAVFAVAGSMGGGGGFRGSALLGTGLLFIAAPLFSLQVLLVILLLGLFVHLLLKVGGGTPRGGLGRTYEALCYGCGANAVSAVPCLGWYFGWIWPIVSSVLTVKEHQRVSGARAAMAVITPPVVGLMLVMTVYVVSMSYFFTRMAARMPAGGGFTTAVASQEDETQIVLGALLAYAGEHRNRLPAHATELVAGGGIGAWDLILSDTGSLAEDVPLGGRTLDDLDQGQAVARRLADAAVKSLPANLAAYRVGDFVFPYVGGTLPVAGDLWLVIASPDPDQNPAVPGSEDVHVGRIDGQVEAIPGAQFDARLQEQNQLRAQHGLPPIPPPEQVLHQAPATAPSGSKMMEAVESPVEAE